MYKYDLSSLLPRPIGNGFHDWNQEFRILQFTISHSMASARYTGIVLAPVWIIERLETTTNRLCPWEMTIIQERGFRWVRERKCRCLTTTAAAAPTVAPAAAASAAPAALAAVAVPPLLPLLPLQPCRCWPAFLRFFDAESLSRSNERRVSITLHGCSRLVISRLEWTTAAHKSNR